MIQDLLDFYLSKTEPNKSCLLSLRKILLANEHITETRKYGMPCFCFKKKIFCYLWIDKKLEEPYILLADGKYLNSPELEMGNRSKMKILRINPSKDLPINTIETILKEAIDLIKG
jgi:hypothetical protein